MLEYGWARWSAVCIAAQFSDVASPNHFRFPANDASSFIQKHNLI